jgi:hypothetical protein
MSKAAPVTAVLVMRWTGRAAMWAGADDASDREPRTELLAARIQLVAEERGRQRRVDEPGRESATSG